METGKRALCATWHLACQSNGLWTDLYLHCGWLMKISSLCVPLVELIDKGNYECTTTKNFPYNITKYWPGNGVQWERSRGKWKIVNQPLHEECETCDEKLDSHHRQFTQASAICVIFYPFFLHRFRHGFRYTDGSATVGFSVVFFVCCVWHVACDANNLMCITNVQRDLGSSRHTGTKTDHHKMNKQLQHMHRTRIRNCSKTMRGPWSQNRLSNLMRMQAVVLFPQSE